MSFRTCLVQGPLMASSVWSISEGLLFSWTPFRQLNCQISYIKNKFNWKNSWISWLLWIRFKILLHQYLLYCFLWLLHWSGIAEFLLKAMWGSWKNLCFSLKICHGFWKIKLFQNQILFFFGIVQRWALHSSVSAEEYLPSGLCVWCVFVG